ncbi:MAG: pantoate--beta-alanine ligase [Candidatus Parabeggiatoa sp. nov. 1]|nr:MAG: pantoate--beta-alanine ligase [Gammaproteobacteria bacterium]
MKIIESVSQASVYVADMRASGKKIGFVPTLGGLHKGHQLLMQRAREENDAIIISIFLNPMQFRKPQFLKYPSDFEQDMRVAEEINVDMIFHPPVAEMFQHVAHIDNFFKFQTAEAAHRQDEHFVIEQQDENGIDNLVRVPSNLVYQLDGKIHPWTFDGAATIVYKLFNILQPESAYFGEKDIQQLAILTKMAETYFPAIKVIGVPTLRDADNLAFSSRNVLLSDEQRRTALSVYHALKHGEHLIRTGESDAAIVLNAIKAIIAAQPLIKIDYIDIVDKRLLKYAKKISDDMILYAAFFLNGIRLTDTLIVEL